MTNPTPTNPKGCDGKKYLKLFSGSKLEWTPMVPADANDQYGADVAVSGTVFESGDSEKDNSFARTRSTVTSTATITTSNTWSRPTRAIYRC